MLRKILDIIILGLLLPVLLLTYLLTKKTKERLIKRTIEKCNINTSHNSEYAKCEECNINKPNICHECAVENKWQIGWHFA